MDKLTLRIEQDESPESPREWSNVGVLCLDGLKNYDLVDSGAEGFIDKADDQYEYMRLARKEYPIVLPVMAYIHGGMSLYVGEHKTCQWDSGFAGCIYATRESIKENFGYERLNEKRIEIITKAMEQEIETMNQYINGDVYGYIVEDEDGDHLDSCWGFYGYEEAEREGKEALKSEQESLLIADNQFDLLDTNKNELLAVA